MSGIEARGIVLAGLSQTLYFNFQSVCGSFFILCASGSSYVFHGSTP